MQKEIPNKTFKIFRVFFLQISLCTILMAVVNNAEETFLQYVDLVWCSRLDRIELFRCSKD